MLYMYYYFIIIDKSNILHVAGKLEQAEHKSRIFNMFDWIQCGRPSASHPQDAVYQNHANSQAQSDDATFAVCAFVLRYQPRMCARQSATAADTNTFYRARLLPRLVFCAAAYQNQVTHIKGVPRRRADECMWIAHSTLACACDMCIRPRSFPHLSSALLSLRRPSNENRGRSPACYYE